MSLISLLHQPIYKIRLSIKDLRRLGATSSQILSMVSVQLSVLSCIMAIFGYLVGQTLILFWPNLQQFPIAGMIIKPNHTDIFIPLFLISSFSIISGLYAYYYTKIEYFKFKI
jgi:ABC-type antimicrobial peptide transport system permease subunit